MKWFRSFFSSHLIDTKEEELRELSDRELLSLLDEKFLSMGAGNRAVKILLQRLFKRIRHNEVD